MDDEAERRAMTERENLRQVAIATDERVVARDAAVLSSLEPQRARRARPGCG
jgi:hypothetical protein